MKKSMLISAVLLIICAVIVTAGCIQINIPGSQVPIPTPEVITEYVYVESSSEETGVPELSAEKVGSHYDRDLSAEYVEFNVYNLGTKTANEIVLYVDARYSDSLIDATGNVYVGSLGPNQGTSITVPIYYNSDRDYMDEHTFETYFDWA